MKAPLFIIFCLVENINIYVAIYVLSSASIVMLILYIIKQCNLLLLFILFLIDIDTRRLERCSIQWNAKNITLGSTLFCCFNDIWKLCAIQLACCYIGGRIFL